MTINEAFQQTLRKWEGIINELYGHPSDYPACGLCNYLFTPYCSCSDCILVKWDLSCGNSNSFYQKFQLTGSIEDAQNMYTFLLFVGHAEGLL